MAFRFLNIYCLRVSYVNTLFTSFLLDTFSFLTPLMSQIPHNLVTSSSSIITVMYIFLLLPWGTMETEVQEGVLVI